MAYKKWNVSKNDKALAKELMEQYDIEKSAVAFRDALAATLK